MLVNETCGSKTRGAKVQIMWAITSQNVIRKYRFAINNNPAPTSQSANRKSEVSLDKTPKVITRMVSVANSSAGLNCGKNLRKPNQK